MTLLLRFWREGVIALAVLSLIVACHSRDTALRDRGIAEERFRVADSTIKAQRPQLMRTDTLIVRDTVKVRVAVNRVVTLRDTVLAHLTDTLVVKEFVTRADSAAKACVELSNDCQAFRASATATIHALELKVATAPQAKPQRHLASDILKVSLSFAAGYLAHR